ncbi:hypothetical protein WH96_07470 [Kiloniella spongiae]|uniref:Pole-organizing protein PopZ n=1 Tax=Kiloniella spongiae TaxID=1489064 RepID=A0A0H2MGH4_9PROT|nr:DUF2497 domain-containing protein [Kiloniella spongiae]KLN61453.1 hypothetical protein WH96_07470 [Kiloniella spongiae]
MSDQEAEAQGEPSMEEILASIRRIISEDDPEGEASEGTEAQAEEPAADEPEAEDDDVLELTDEVAEDEASAEEEPVETASDEDSIEDDFRSSMGEPEEDEIEVEEVAEEPELEADQESVEDTDLGDISFDEVEVEVEDEIEIAAVAEEPQEEAVDIDLGDDIDLDAPDAESILQEETQDSTSSALSEIARAAVVQRSLAIGTGKTLEDIVREALVPELKAWLDVRLGPMVERIVREEIKKMVRRAEDL